MADTVIKGDFGQESDGKISIGPDPGTDGAVLTGAALTRFAIWQIRQNKKIHKTTDAMARAIFNRILVQEAKVDGGTFIFALPERRCYVLSGKSTVLYEISPRDEDFAAYLWLKYGLLKTESITKHVTAALAAYCRMRGLRRQVRRFTCWDRRKRILYVSRYNGTAWKIDGSGYIDVVANGTGPALFIDDDDGATVEEPFVAEHRKLIPTLVDNINYVETTAGGLTRKQQRLALGIWMFSIAFPDLMTSKPLLLVEGEKGSGKTSAAQLIQRAVHGAKRKTHAVAKDDEREFPIKLLRSPICIIDNVDSFVDWMQDGISTYVTGGGWTRRKLYTDDADVKLDPQSFIVITSRNPLTFKRDDVADRCLILRLQRREENRPMSLLEQEVDEERIDLYGEWLFLLDKIVAEIRSGKLDARMASSTHRMADFAALAHVIGKILDASEDEVEELLDAMQDERDVLIAEGDPLVDLLDRWLENQQNVGRQITANDLYAELSDIAREKNRNFYKSPGTLSQKLRSQAVKKLYDIREVGMRGNAKVHEIRRNS